MKVKIEIEDDGMRSTHVFEGEIVRDKVIDFLAAAGVFREGAKNGFRDAAPPKPEDNRTLRDRLEIFVREEFPESWFSSNELRDRYEAVSDDIKLSTVSTYLSRMYYDGVLERRGNRNQRQYRLVTEEFTSEVKYPGKAFKEASWKAESGW
jgi:DNA-binding transcriptional ArsR family regulator